MSWLGKILTFLVLIASVAWMALTLNVYVTRTNWKARADAAEKALKESETNRRTELSTSAAEVARIANLLSAERSRTADLDKTIADQLASSSKSDEDFRKWTTNHAAVEQRERLLVAQQKATLSELEDTRKRNTVLENDRVQLVRDAENANRERLRAENDAKLARAISDENVARAASLQAQLSELRQSGGGGGAATVLRSVDKAPPPVPENVRGTVVSDLAGSFVEISVGLDAGVTPGARLDVFRETNGGRYLGTLVVTKSAYPKNAVAEFRPARQVPVSQLKPEELPRKGDQVSIVGDPRPNR
ncbi:hypothetical protein GobsT_75220 [Gemmata obscuriglobus]|uniref:Uncharacterized protein n=1 Tax=Gemmata obscuriglobus TaxID=114 RepID=A0A2Z3HIY4_9BACT|nr:hypothetical protein [Gemmata obscuriglobus]AWM41430.1 hypothetical protein C1280_33490 [Gemmata obscuriglobus]QEG32664.1 hypothetical protein GobsT_75220 [Gemmata obscuriglobus]VTS12020.1 Uncharacterized protein OS=Blastopirellula marina DSM 3645 GN=DSM3645_09607 PE=4 SV=1 [Gemmata obscuriglobus UQM 2246]